jgi:Carbohydrate binding module (family 6)
MLLAACTSSSVDVKPRTGMTPVGVGLEGVADFSRGDVFVNIMKQARGFGLPDQPWEVGNDSTGANPSLPLDASGYPTVDFGIVVFAARLPGSMAGTYKLEFKGQADNLGLIASGDAKLENKIYDAATDTTRADVMVGQSEQLMIKFGGTRNGARDIKLIRPGYAANTTEVFNKAFVAALEPFDALRLMDWTSTNNNAVSKWTERSKMSDAFQTTNRGVAWEYGIELANQTGKNLWVNVPANADDDYVREMAKLFNTKLRPELNLYVEYSNEVWNGGFQQFQQNLQLAKAEVSSNPSSSLKADVPFCRDPNDENTWWIRRVAKRLKEVSDIFKTEFGASSLNTRVRPVLAHQIGNSEIVRSQLCYANATFGPPKEYFYAIAGAPYYNLGDDLQTRDGLTTDQIIQALEKQLEANRSIYEEPTSLAAYFELKNLAYEGGTDTFGDGSIPAKANSARDPRMREITQRYLNEFHAYGGEMMMYFTLSNNWDTKYGTWGLIENFAQLNAPKYQGVQAVIAAPRAPLTIGNALPATINALEFVGKPASTTDPYLRYVRNGAYRDYILRAPSNGTYQLRLEAATGGGGQANLEFKLNNASVARLEIRNTGDWEVFKDSSAVALNLKAGLNTLRLIVNPGDDINIKALKITP